MTTNKEKKNKGKRLKGTVVSTAMEKTVVVSVSRFVKHPKYGKYIEHRKRYKAHVEGTKPEIGAAVVIEETRPISRDKHFRLVDKLNS